MRFLMLSLLLVALAATPACSDDSPGDAAAGDASPDAPRDAATDAPADGSSDASRDAAPSDASPDGATDGGTIDPDAPPRLVSARTLSATTVELAFNRPVTGTNLGFSLHGTRSDAFDGLTGFGTATLVGTVAADIVYGEVATLSYDDTVGDVTSGPPGEDMRLPWYRRELITNHEAFSGDEIYVSADATGSGDGTRAAPFSIVQINSPANVAAGMRINIAKGVYSQGLTVSRSGEAGRPTIYEGYDTEPGDLDYDVFHPTYPVPLDADRMPLLDGGDRDTNGGVGVIISNRRFVTFKNLQVTEYRHGFSSSYSTPSDNLNFINCATENIGVTTSRTQGSGFNITFSSTLTLPFNISFVHGYARNSAMANYGVAGDDLFIYETRSYSDQDVYPGSGEFHWSTDYHFGIKNADDGVIRRSHAENVGDLEHTAHGISIRSDNGDTSHRVLIDDCDVVNINGSIELRHDEVKYALARNVRMTGGDSRYAGGIHIRDGASFNTIDGCSVSGITAGSNGAIAFYDSSEEGYGQRIEGNVIMNSVFSGVNLLFRMSSSRVPVFEFRDNALYNNTFYDIDTAYRRYDGLTVTDFLGTNNISSGVATRDHGGSAAPAGLVETSSDYFDGYAMPAGDGNVSVDPMFVDGAGGDLHLGSGSPVRGAGVSIPEVVHDFDGVERAAASPSLGAYE